MKRWSIGIAAMALASIAAPAVAGVAEGNAAWLKGDYNTAVAEWRPAADAGVPEAQFNLGQAYKLGRGVVMNLEEAEKWYRKAAQQGFADAQDVLGLMLFRDGERQEAMPWIEKSAARGDPRAMYVLGTAKFNGDFAAKDWPGAYLLLSRAAAAGIPQARQSLDQMAPYLTAADKAAAGSLPETPMARAEPPPSPRVPEGTGGYVPVNPGLAATGRAAPPPEIYAQAPPSSQQPAYQPPAMVPPSLPAPQSMPPQSMPPPVEGPTVMVDGATVAVPGPEVGVRPEAAPPPYRRTPTAPPPMQPQPAPIQSAESTARPAPRPTPPRPANGPWKIQLGSFATPGGASEAWAKLGRRVGALRGLRYATQPYGAMTRLQAAGLASKADAVRVCRSVVAAGNGCFPVAP